MGTDCHLIIELKSEHSEDYDCICGEIVTCRYYEAFEKIRDYLNSGLPDHPSWEVKDVFDHNSKEQGYFGFGWMYYDDFLKHGGKKIWNDPYKKKLHPSIRVFIYFDC